MKLLIAVAAGAVVLSLAPRAALADPYEYNRGYRDCLSGRFDQDNDSRSYHRGCRAAREGGGGEERPHHWRPGPPPGPPPGAGGPPPFFHAGIPNVRGMDPVRALQTLASRGYANVGTSVVGGAIAGIYFNPQTRECVQTTAVGGRVVDVRPSADSRCR